MITYPQYRYGSQPAPFGSKNYLPQAVIATPRQSLIDLSGLDEDMETDVSKTKPASDDGHRVPLSNELLSAYADCLLIGQILTYEAIIEFEAMCTIALAERMITSSENERFILLRQEMFDRARRLRLEVEHSGVYTRCLRLIYRMVYSYRPESVTDWQAAAHNVDLNHDVFRPREYDTLVKLIQEHSCEVENAVYRARGASHMCTVNPNLVNYVSYDSLVATADGLRSMALPSSASIQLLLAKAEAAFSQGYITDKQWEEIRTGLSDTAPEVTGVQRMNLL